MTLLTLVSRADPASVNIGKQLRTRAKWEEVATFRDRPVLQHDEMLVATIEEKHLHADGVDAKLKDEAGLDFDGVVVASRHAARSGRPSLTVHPIGNWGDEARYGGEPHSLVPCLPAVQARLLLGLRDAARDLPHDATFEATHHGPLLETPTCFLEIGTTEDHWMDPRLGGIMADLILDLAHDPPPVAPMGAPVLLAVGGGHYAPKHTDLVRSYDCTVGHILPGYHLKGGVDEGMLEQAVETTPGCNGYVLNQPEGLAHQEEVEERLQDLGILPVTKGHLRERNPSGA